MRKLLLLLFSLLLSFNSYGESYKCSRLGFGAEDKLYHTVYKRKNNQYFLGGQFENLFIANEGEKFIILTNVNTERDYSTIPEGYASVVNVVISKENLSFIYSVLTADNRPNNREDKFKVGVRKGQCIKLDF